MKSLRLILASLSLALVLPSARAQLLTAEDFFNDGAHSYLSNNIPLALTNVETGLKFYPGDEKLQKLEKLLKQQQQQQNQQQQNQQQNQQNQDQKNQQSKNNQNSQQQNSQNQQNQSQPDQQKKDSQSQPDKDQQQNQQDQNKQNQQPQNAQQAKADEQKAGETNGEPQKVAAGQMTPEEAKRLLDQQKGNEQVLVMKPNGKPRDDTHPIKDW